MLVFCLIKNFEEKSLKIFEKIADLLLLESKTEEMFLNSFALLLNSSSTSLDLFYLYFYSLIYVIISFAI